MSSFSKDFNSKGIKLLLANWKAPQRDLLERSGFYEHVTDDTIFLNLHDAAMYAKTRARHSADESRETGKPFCIDDNNHPPLD